MSSNREWQALGFDLTSLRIFAAAAEEGSLAKAAARENIALSAVSRRISDLEHRAGVQLFERRDRGVELTAAGAQLLGQLHNVFRLFDHIANDLQAFRDGVRGQVRIQTHMSTAPLGLAQVLAAFLKANPGIEIEIEELTSVDVVHAVRTGMADIGLVAGTVDPEGLEIIPWQVDELVAVVPEGHPLGTSERLCLADMLSWPFVGMQRDSALIAFAREQARLGGRELCVRAYSASFESARSMVAAGLGIAVLPSQAVGDGGALGLIVRPLSDPWARRELLICVRDLERLSPAGKLCVNHLIATNGKLSAASR